jgi:hypothetical protein
VDDLQLDLLEGGAPTVHDDPTMSRGATRVQCSQIEQSVESAGLHINVLCRSMVMV